MGPPARYVPVDARPWKLRMGLRPLDPSAWLEVDDARRDELATKHTLLDSPATHPAVVASIAGSEACSQALLRQVLDHLDRYHPGLVTTSPDGRLTDTATGYGFYPDTMHPIDAAGRLVQEDLCLMTRSRGEWILSAASVCFPSRWSLATKVGRDLSGIHAPVPGYEEHLGEPTRAFFDRLRPQRPVWRLNWTILGDPGLHQPDSAGRAAVPPSPEFDPRSDLWFRVERQTLSRMEVEAVVFTIRTYVTPLGLLVDSHPAAGPALRSALSGLSHEVMSYKGWEGIAARVVEWLGRARGSSPSAS